MGVRVWRVQLGRGGLHVRVDVDRRGLGRLDDGQVTLSLPHFGEGEALGPQLLNLFAGTDGAIQCDQMVRLFFKNWPLSTIKINPIMNQICQSRLNTLPNKKLTVKNLPKTCKVLPNLATLVPLVRNSVTRRWNKKAAQFFQSCP